MKRILITGFCGFVGRYFLDYLENEQIHMNVMGIDRNLFKTVKKYKHLNISSCNVDLLERKKVKKIILDFKPDYLLHLASFSSVAYSWEHPIESFQNNTNIFLNLIESIRELNLPTRILSIGSSEEYGNIDEKDIPIKESNALNPLSPYAVARVSQEMLAKIFVNSYGLDIVLTRSFNHIGPRQKDIFVISSFAKKLIEIKREGLTSGKITTGDTSIIRDFLDVRDVVEIYYKLLVSGKKGEVYNICSGQGMTLKSVLEKMAQITNLKIDTVTDERLIRPDDNRVIIGSNEKIKDEIGWTAKFPLEDSLRDILEYWNQELKKQTYGQ